MGERIELHIEKHARLQRAKAQWPLFDKAAVDPASVGERWQQQRIGPDGKTRCDARHGAARRGPAPDQAAEEGRCQLRHGGERNETHLGKGRS